MGKNNNLRLSTTTTEYGKVVNKTTQKEDIIMKKRTITLVVLVALVVLLASFAGCKKKPEVVPDSSSKPVASEEVSETPSSEEVSEPASEEVSEVASEEVSEEPVVEEVNFSSPNELKDSLKKTNKTTIVEYDFSQEGKPQMIIPNGSKYTMQLGYNFSIITVKEVENIEAGAEYISINESVFYEGEWNICILATGTDLEVPLTIKYADGTEEEILLYVTNTF